MGLGNRTMSVESRQSSPHSRMLDLFGRRQSPGNLEAGGNVQSGQFQGGSHGSGRMGPPPRPKSGGIIGSLGDGGPESGERESIAPEDSGSDMTI